jgi:uncharacterized protein YdaU (DUF1376 family)
MKKRSDVWLPLYVGDYLADTMHLCAAGHGAYLLLLMHSWRNGPLPDDDRALANIARADAATWKRIGPDIRGFLTATEAGLVQPRLERERERTGGLVEQRIAAGKASAEKRRQQREGQREAQRSGERNHQQEGNARSTSVADPLQRKARQSQSQDPSSLRSDGAAGAAPPVADTLAGLPTPPQGADTPAGGAPPEAADTAAGQPTQPQAADTPAGGLTPPQGADTAAGGAPPMADTPAGPPPDARAAVFGEGLARLRGLTGRAEAPARAMLGRWLRVLDDDCARLSGILADAAALRPADPVAWIEAAVGLRAGQPVNGRRSAVTEALHRFAARGELDFGAPAGPVILGEAEEVARC